MPAKVTLIHIFIDHSNIWGGTRAASRIHNLSDPDRSARISIRNLDRLLGGDRQGVSTKIVSGGIRPGMEGVWEEYQKHGYDTQRLFRDQSWKERGVDHSIIGHMWRLLAKHQEVRSQLVLASGDGKKNEFGTSFYEVLDEVLRGNKYEEWTVRLASFDWPKNTQAGVPSPTNQRLKKLVEESDRGESVNLDDHYSKVVFHKPWLTVPPRV